MVRALCGNGRLCWRAAPQLEHFNIFYLSFKHTTFLMLFIFVRLSPSHSSGAPPLALLLRPQRYFGRLLSMIITIEAKRGENHYTLRAAAFCASAFNFYDW
jgi:hypothetical protein